MTTSAIFFKKVCMALGISMSFFTEHAESKGIDSINWAINTAPPFHITDGSFSGQGICDVLIDVVDSYLTNISSERIVLPQTRIRQEFQRDTNQCFPCMIYRETPGDTIQTDPTHFYYPHGIITTKQKASRMKARHGNPIRLASLITDQSFRFGFPDGRHYPAVQNIIDNALKSNIPHVALTGENATVAILEMIKKERIDYTLEYRILQHFDILTDEKTNLVFLEIEETPQDEYVLGAIGCTNNQWGKAIVQEINRVMPLVRQHPEFLKVLELWFGKNYNADTLQMLLEKRLSQAPN